MIITTIVIAAAILALIFFVLRGFGAARSANVQQLVQQIEPVDLEAFRNLTDPSEDAYLRNSLPEGQYQTIQRERLGAAIAYLGGVSRNAGILLQLGQLAQQSSDERVTEAGRRLTDDALRLRISSMMAICKLGIRYAFPNAALQPGGVIDGYQRLTSAAVRLGRMQEPERSAFSRAG